MGNRQHRSDRLLRKRWGKAPLLLAAALAVSGWFVTTTREILAAGLPCGRGIVKPTCY